MNRRVFLGCVGAASCNRREGAVRMVVGGQGDMVYLPATLAQQLGFYESSGVHVQIEDTGAGSKSLQAILGGSADVASGFYDHTIQMAAEGKQVTSFVAQTRYPGGVLVTSPQAAARIQRIADLKGANIGVTAPGSSSHFFVNHLLVSNGLKTDDVQIIGTGGGRARIAAIESGRVDAGVLYEPSASVLMKRAPGARLLADARTAEGVRALLGAAEYPSAVFYATGGWLKQNGQAARRMAQAMRETLAWIAAHSAAEIAAKMPASLIGEDRDVYVQALTRVKPMYSPDGVMRPEPAEAVRKVLALSLEKVRAARIDLAQTYTNEFVLN